MVYLGEFWTLLMQVWRLTRVTRSTVEKLRELAAHTHRRSAGVSRDIINATSFLTVRVVVAPAVLFMSLPVTVWC